MLIMKNSTETITYWEESKLSVQDSDLDGISSIRRSASNSPVEPSCDESFCKEDNLLYPGYDRNFNFPTNAGGGTSDDDEYHQPSLKRKITVTRDPMSHRIIEKRRRDRMNNCLADLSRLIPAEYLKKGRGRIEKTEIIEMAIKHMKYLQALTCNAGEACDTSDNMHASNSIHEKQFVNGTKVLGEPELSSTDHYKLGYQECLAETMRFLVELQGFFPTDTLCVKMINHLQKYFEKLAKGEKLMTSIRENVVLQPSELERKANEYRQMTAEVSRNMTNSVSNSINSDDSYQDNTFVDGRFQEIHANSHYGSLYLPSTTADIHSQSSPESFSSQQDLNDGQSSNSSMYKFKNYIRERFEHSNPDKPTIPSVVVCSKKRRADSTNTLNTSPPIPEHLPKCSRPVPIFALHGKGSFYVPLTIDSNLLSPFVSELNGDYGIQGFSPLLLHPVTISVNFNRPLLQSSPSSSPILSSNMGLSASVPTGSMLMMSDCR